MKTQANTRTAHYI